MKRPGVMVICTVVVLIGGGPVGAEEVPKPPGSPPMEPLNPEEAQRYRELDERPLHTFTNVDVAEYLPLRRRAQAENGHQSTPAEKIVQFAHKAFQTPFRLNAVRFDYSEQDCVVFVERCLAMACARDWESYYRTSERVRHKDGNIDYRNRNFSTLGDWVPNNAWLFVDVTPSLPGTEEFQHIVRPKVFEEIQREDGVRVVFKGHDWKTKNTETRSGHYLPSAALEGASADLRPGDVCIIIRGIGKRVGSDHMGLLDKDESGEVMFLQGALPSARSQSLPLFLRQNRHVDGIMVLRVRPDALARTAEAIGKMNCTPPAPDQEDDRVRRWRESRQAR